MSIEDQDVCSKIQIKRKLLVDVFFDSNYKTFDRKFDEVVDFVGVKTDCPKELRKIVVQKELRNFKTQFAKKWSLHNRFKERFLSVENAWLAGLCEFTRYSHPKGGRPSISFAESSDSAKRKKTAEIRSQLDADTLTYAAQMKLRSSGRCVESEVIKKVAGNPKYAKDCLNATSSTKTNKVSAHEALSLIIEAQLSRKQYELIRSYAPDVFPSYKVVQSEKPRCYPKDVEVTETEAIVPIQSLLNHTASSLLKSQIEVLKSQDINNDDKVVLYSKWGFDGSSSHTQYKQKFVSEASDDKYMFLSCLVPLRMVCERANNTIILWQNPKPSSPRLCRPISLQYLKESEDLVKSRKQDIDNQINYLQPTKIVMDGTTYNIEHKLIFTMVDGKLCNLLSDTKFTMKCYLCNATSKEFNDLDKMLQKPLNTEYISFGISILHAWIRLFESLLHISYKMPVRTWRVNKELKQTVDENKARIQKEFHDRLSLIVDKPKPGYGNSNDGNVARKFFQSPEISAAITGIDQQLIKRLYVILQTISSGFKINLVKFKTFCLETASLYVNLYPWMPMTPTMHKILVHGPEIVTNALLPIGMLSEEAQESRNKDFKTYREYFSRKTSRTDNLVDIINRLFLSSDPFISLMRIRRTENRKSFDPEVLDMLEEEY